MDPKIETNPFPWFLPARPARLIIGSFPCFNGTNYGDWFYSGSGRNHFWQLLSDSLGMPAANRAEKEKLCEEHGIALTDIAHRVIRKKNNCSDANLLIVEYNRKGLDTCLGAGIKKVFFTSGFVKSHFERLYPAHEIPGSLLLSPSPAANMHIGGLEEYKKLKAEGKIRSPYEFRLLKYREQLTG